MTETLSTSKEVPKIKPALQEKYDQEKKVKVFVNFLKKLETKWDL